MPGLILGGRHPRARWTTSVDARGVASGGDQPGRDAAGGGIVAAVKQFLGIVAGLSLAFAGLGATVAFGVFAFIGMPMLVLGLGIFSAALDS